MKNKKVDLVKFETLKIQGEILKGGFTTALMGGKLISQVDDTNNGNCVAGCSGVINRFICLG